MLYFIPTPIGNKEDISLRAIRLLKQLKLFLCEDTRTTKKLLAMYDINYKDKQFYAFTSFTNQSKMNSYQKLITENEIAIISEAGTP
ncbi:MAG: hypothetical protein LBD75_03205 [Candidatus Peribacteria bacterium]|jgi:16S rRNA (cytidine1402-2'-O)-methyltransferase|nr:hypothetical protein [Candidatus Peribacteria bacterium]